MNCRLATGRDTTDFDATKQLQNGELSLIVLARFTRVNLNEVTNCVQIKEKRDARVVRRVHAKTSAMFSCMLLDGLEAWRACSIWPLSRSM